MLNKDNTKHLSALFLSSLFFGSTFIIVKILLNVFSPVSIVFIRYFIASIIFLILGGIPSKSTWKPGLYLGIFLWVGYATQTQGLTTTTTVNSGVVTGFYIVLTPFFSKFINKTNLTKKNYYFSFLGFLGIVLISLSSVDQLFGNIFTLICAFAYAIHIVLVERYVNFQKISQLMFVQSFIGMMLCIPFINFSETSLIIENILYLLFLGILVNVAAFYLQLFGQKKVAASTSALILSLEAVFALFIGIIYANEFLTLVNWFGIVLILVSIFFVIKE